MAEKSGSPDSKPRLLTVPEVAERLGVGERMVRRLIFEKRIPYHKIGDGRAGHVRIDERDVGAYLDATRVEAIS